MATYGHAVKRKSIVSDAYWKSDRKQRSKSWINYFGFEVHSPYESLSDPYVVQFAARMLSREGEVAGNPIDRKVLSEILTKVAGPDGAQAHLAIRDLEYRVIRTKQGRSAIKSRRTLDATASLCRTVTKCGAQLGTEMLDLGCGSGAVSASLVQRSARGTQLLLADVLDYRDPAASTRAFEKLQGSGPLPFLDDQFSDVLLVTVLHHANDPLALLAEASRVCRGCMFIMETIVDVASVTNSVTPNPSAEDLAFAALPLESQIKHAGFQDWFFNAVVEGGVAVPLNFASDAIWRGCFADLGLKVLHVELVGFDQVTAPEFHVVYVVTKG